MNFFKGTESALEFNSFIDTPTGRILPTERQEFANEKSGMLQISFKYGTTFQDDFYFQVYPEHTVCRRIFKNISGKTQYFNEIGVELTNIKFGGDAAKDYFYHNENPRIYERMTFPVDYSRTGDAKDSEFDAQAGNRWADPGVVSDRIGRSPYQPFPAILLSNYQTSEGLVHGTLSQREFYHNYLVSHQSGSVKLEIFSGFKGVGTIEFAANRNGVDEWYLGMTHQADNYDKIFENYLIELKKHLPPAYGATNINRTSMVWGSWNDGIFRDINEDMLLKEAKYLKENFPMVEWMQIDDGYAVNVPPAHGLGMPYEGEKGVDYQKFPEGLRKFTDKIKEIGLRPAIWIGGFCPKFTPIYQEHPEWFINYDYRVTESSPLDVSQEEVRKYMMHALDVLLTDYGFEGMKHDFWSYAFEDSSDLLKNKDQSGYHWRDWWLKEVRKRLSSNGYLQTGCDIVMGNPFLGEFFTNYRYGIDIGSGNWDFVKTNFLWGVACFATHSSDLIVPNSDSVGLFPGLNDTEAMFCLDYCLVTHSMVEIAGKLSEFPGAHRLEALKKTVCAPNNGQEVFLAHYDYRNDKQLIPDTLYFKTPHFSPLENQPALPLRTVGLFNINEQSEVCGFTAADLGLPNGKYILTDIRSGEHFVLNGKFSLEVIPHGSRVFGVSESSGIQLLDANIKISQVQLNGNQLLLNNGYPGSAQFVFNLPVKSVKFNGEKIDCCINGMTVKVNVLDCGELTFEF